MGRYGSFSRPVGPWMKVSEPFELDRNHRRNSNQDPFDVIVTKNPLPESDLFNFELKDLDILSKQRELQAYLNSHDLKIGVRTAISKYIQEGKVTSIRDVDKWINKAKRR